MPHFIIAHRHPPTQPAAIVRAAGLREQAVVTDLLLRANRDYRTVLPARLYDVYMRDLRALAASARNWNTAGCSRRRGSRSRASSRRARR